MKMSFIRRSFPLPLMIIILLLFCKGLIWTVLIPPFQTPDEPVHFAYVQYIAEEHKLPIYNGSSRTQLSQEMLNFISYVNLSDIAFHPSYQFSLSSREVELLTSEKYDKFLRLSSGSTYVSGYPPAYYLIGSIAYDIFYMSPIMFRFYAVRIMSVLISILAPWATYHITRKIFADSPSLWIAAAVIVGFQPMYSMIGASVNNDVLMDALTPVLLLWLLHVVQKWPNNRTSSFILGGVILALGLLTKAEMVYVTGMVLVFLVLRQLLFRESIHEMTKLVKSWVAIIIPIIIMYGAWVIGISLPYYHSLIGTMGYQATLPGSGSLWSYISQEILGPSGFNHLFFVFVQSFWADFGWLDTSFSFQSIYNILLFFMIVALLVSAWSAIRPPIHRASNVLYRWGSIVSVLCFIGNIGFLLAVEYMYFKQYHTTMLQGRYMLTALAPLAIMFIITIDRIPKRYVLLRRTVPSLVVFSAIALNIASILLEVHRYYGVAF